MCMIVYMYNCAIAYMHGCAEAKAESVDRNGVEADSGLRTSDCGLLRMVVFASTKNKLS